MISQPPQCDRRTLRFSWYEIGFVLIGCAIVSFRTGRIITPILHQQIHSHFPVVIGPTHATQPQFLYMTSNGTTSTTRIPSTQIELTMDGKTGFPSSSSSSRVPNLFNDTGSSRSRCCPDFQSLDYNMDLDRQHHEQRVSTLLSEEQELQLSIGGHTRRKPQRREIERSKYYYYYEAMVHPALLIHPQPYRVVILYDMAGHIIPLVLQHSAIHEVICILPESSSHNNSLLSLQIDHDEWSQRITWVYTNDPITYFQHSTEMIDIVYVDYLTYVDAEVLERVSINFVHNSYLFSQSLSP
jgi:hypothetical protein